MKAFIHFCLVIMLSVSVLASFAQNDPRSSSKSAAQYDAASVIENIADDKDAMYFSQMAINRGSVSETIEIARDMLTDFTGLLYSMEQLASAGGTGSKSSIANNTLEQARSLNESLKSASGFSFDTAWLGGMARMHQVNLDGLVQQKEYATNERLKSAVTEAIPVLKKYITRLTSLQKKLIKQDLQEKKEAERREKAEAAERERNSGKKKR